MKRIILASVLFSMLALSQASFSIADTIWATNVVDTQQGIGFGTVGRSDMINALGAPDGLFYSPGIGGWAIFEFVSLFNVGAIVVETTYGSRDKYVEKADIFVSSTDFAISSFTLADSISNATNSTTIDLSSFAGPFRYLMVKDTTQIGGDGFDINAVGVNPVPEPATMLLFGVGLAGLASVKMRRKKK